MKIEADLQSFFLRQFPVVTPELRNLSEHFWIDLTSHVEGYFDETQQKAITKMACNRIKTSYIPLNQNWRLIVLDFIQNANWGFKPLRKKPKKPLTEEQKNSRQLFRYGWAFFQSMIILKIAVYYFGLESAENPDRTNPMWVWFFFGLSAGSLIFFAYRNRHDDRTDQEKNPDPPTEELR